MTIKWVKMHHFGPRFQDMKATGLLFHMVKARLESVHFSIFYGNVSIRSFSVLFLSKNAKIRSEILYIFVSLRETRWNLVCFEGLSVRQSGILYGFVILSV